MFSAYPPNNRHSIAMLGGDSNGYRHEEPTALHIHTKRSSDGVDDRLGSPCERRIRRYEVGPIYRTPTVTQTTFQQHQPRPVVQAMNSSGSMAASPTSACSSSSGAQPASSATLSMSSSNRTTGGVQYSRDTRMRAYNEGGHHGELLID